jgi:hypothetical protein
MIIVVLYIIVSLFFLPTLVSAQEPTTLHVQNVNGTMQSSLLVDIQHITFEEDVLVLTTTEGEFRLPLDNVEKLTFGNGIPSAVEDVNINAIKIYKSGNQLTIESDYAIEHLYLVDMSGKVLKSKKLASINMTTITLSTSGAFVLFLETSQGYSARKVVHN